jgi:hypothetical protein
MKKLLLLFILTFSFSSYASILIEPYFGTAMNSEIEIGNNDAEEYSSGSSTGARLGYQSMGLQLGIDYRMHSNESEVNNIDTEHSHNAIYGFVGYEFPVMFRVFAGMAVSGSGEATLGSSDYDLSDLSSTTLGISYKGLPFIAINFEMVNYSFDTVENSSGDEVDIDYSGSHYLLSLSLPINL